MASESKSIYVISRNLSNLSYVTETNTAEEFSNRMLNFHNHRGSVVRAGVSWCRAQLGTISVGPGSQSIFTKVCYIGSNWSNWLQAGLVGRPPLERERNVLFNDALNTIYLRLYGVRHMVKDHSVSEKGNPLPPHRLLFPINSKGSFICTIPQTG